MRSLFEMDTSGLQGKGKVTSATFRLAQRWSGVDCGSGPGAVGLFWTNPINPGVTWNTSWNLDGTGWLRQIGSSSAAFRSDMSGAVCGPNTAAQLDPVLAARDLDLTPEDVDRIGGFFP